VTANAPVTIASPDSGGDASQDGASAGTSSEAGTSSSGDQDVGNSSGAAQVGSVDPGLGAAAAAPVTANAPITVLSPNSGGDASQPGATAESSSAGGSGSGEQDVNGSSGSAQVGSADAGAGAAAAAPVTTNAPITVLSPNSGGDATQGGSGATSETGGGDAGSGGDQTTDGSTGSGQIGTLDVSPVIDADAPLTTNTPITILSPGSGGDSTGPTPPGTDTPTDPDDTPPTDPGPDTPTGPDSPPQGSPPGTGGDDDSSGGGGPTRNGPSGPSGPSADEPSRGTQGEFQPNAGSPTSSVERSELGAPAGDLPFTGLLLWLIALIGLAALGAGTTGRWATAH
jgi:hypothetical protein